jgi:hypothetical protein
LPVVEVRVVEIVHRFQAELVVLVVVLMVDLRQIKMVSMDNSQLAVVAAAEVEILRITHLAVPVVPVS